ncbi:ribokinase isoform X2 [Anastrepha ludens]|uniref:ribokinase isoform X2 n=1 Tax=Anastrepha ludens TaxID=28586 RepID=UPI0023AE6F97|nr:ribokinase isoform X2 [Anastrepha ludens]
MVLIIMPTFILNKRYWKFPHKFSYTERLPKAGETLHGHTFLTGYGGKGANQCVAAARLGAKCAMIAKLGDDTWGSNYLKQLQTENVNVDHVEQCKGATTGIAQISVADSGENHIVIVVGANNLLSGEDVKKAKALFETAKILICQFETPLNATLDALRAFKGISILNAAPALAETPSDLIKAATIFCVNETEAALTTGCGDISTLEHAKTAMKKLLEMGANNVIITLGSLGAVYVRSENPLQFIHVPAIKVTKVVDTTGAGDAFIGALAFNMARFRDSPWYNLIGAANEVAAYSVQHPGTQASFPKPEQMQRVTDYTWLEI